MSFPMFNFGPNPDDIHYLHLDTIVQGKGPDRLKYLDLEGRWTLSGRSIPYISAAFNHIEELNYAKGAIFDIVEPALNAIGGVSWTPEQQEIKEEVVERKKKPFTIPVPPVVAVDGEVPPSPREIVPHRSAGYGPAHQKRKLSVPDRSRSNSVNSRGASPVPEFNKYAVKYGSKGETMATLSRGSSGVFTGDSDDDLPPPPACLMKQDSGKSIGAILSELNAFNRKSLRNISDIIRKPFQPPPTPHDKLMESISGFDKSKLKHVEPRESKGPVLAALSRKKPFEELYVVIPIGQKTGRDEGCQTDSGFEDSPLSPTFTESSYDDLYSMDDLCYSPASTESSDLISLAPTPPEPSDSGFRWVLVDEKITQILIIETEIV
uniref:WH1 domain-containing protein n=1 Tax=Panagrellus redivivus TaxID=6233 RepID=A0A7E5A216_PANRE